MARFALLLFALFTCCGCAAAPTSESEVFDDVVQLTAGFRATGEARFSPDMDWIIFQGMPATESHFQLYIARLLKEGERVSGIGHPIRITPENSDNRSGVFSPSGMSVVFASLKGKPEGKDDAAPKSAESKWAFPKGYELYRADAWEAALAAAELARGINLTQHPLTQNQSYDAECTFAPDGKSLLFTSTREADPTKATPDERDADLFSMSPDGTHVVRLTSTPGYEGNAAFSSDGRRIVFRGTGADGSIQLFIAGAERDASGQVVALSTPRAITSDPVAHFSPIWHPDLMHILYASLAPDGRNYDVFMTRTDGTKTLRLTFHDAVDLFPALSKDGKYLMWTSKRSTDGTSQIYIGRFKMPKAG